MDGPHSSITRRGTAKPIGVNEASPGDTYCGSRLACMPCCHQCRTSSRVASRTFCGTAVTPALYVTVAASLVVLAFGMHSLWIALGGVALIVAVAISREVVQRKLDRLAETRDIAPDGA